MGADRKIRQEGKAKQQNLRKESSNAKKKGKIMAKYEIRFQSKYRGKWFVATCRNRADAIAIAEKLSGFETVKVFKMTCEKIYHKVTASKG